MKFLYQRFRGKRGQKVQVDFSQATNIKFFGTRDFDNYKKCRTNSYVGGKYEQSPAVFQVPNDGEWIVVIEKGPMAAPIEVEGKVTLLGDDVDVAVTRALDAPEPVAAPVTVKAIEEVAEEDEAINEDAETDESAEDNEDDEDN